MSKQKFAFLLGQSKAEHQKSLHVVTVYHKPADYPDKFVARLSLVEKAGIQNTDLIFTADTLAEVQASIPEGHYYWMPRQPEDIPCVVGTWM